MDTYRKFKLFFFSQIISRWLDLGSFKETFGKFEKSKPESDTQNELSFVLVEEKYCGTKLSTLFYRKKTLKLILYKFLCGCKVWEDQREFMLVRETNKNKKMQ